MNKGSSTPLAAAALSIFVGGGIISFSGIGYLLFLRGFNFFAPGPGAGMGLLLIFSGFSLSIFGVLLMRICRNRWSR